MKLHVNWWINDVSMLHNIFPIVADRFEDWEGKIRVLN